MSFNDSNVKQSTPSWASNYTMGLQVPQENQDDKNKQLTLEQGLAQNSIFCAYNQ